jgi:hypothetical protein
MAGSIKHCLREDNTYRGVDLLENMGDMIEAVDEMMFVILLVRNRWGGDRVIDDAIERYYRCRRGEEAWPPFMDPEKMKP